MVMRRWIGRRAWITVGSVGIYCAAGRKDIKGRLPLDKKRLFLFHFGRRASICFVGIG